jgi:general secretion pathway protein D
MLCVCTSIHAALNFVPTDTPEQNNVAQHIATPQAATAQPVNTQIDASASAMSNSMLQNDLPLSNAQQRAEAPNTAEDDEDETVEFHFEDADLQNLLNQIASLYQVVFITDDMITSADGKPIEGKKAIKGNKISFKTHKPLTRKAAWSLFLTFLEIAGFTLTKESKPNIYRVVPFAPPNTPIKVPLPTYIGTKVDQLPNNDQMIRYVYFVQNANIDAIWPIVDKLRSTVSSAMLLTNMQAFLITDKAYNIVSLMEIVAELDKVTMPQAMSVLKLKRVDAEEVKTLYEQLTGTGKNDPGAVSRLFPGRKEAAASYFPESLRIIPYKRSNALILLGAEDAIKKIEEFITQHVDVDITAPYPPVRVHNLRYANAESIAKIMNNMNKFGRKTGAGEDGGVRGDDKYIKPMTFTPEPISNRLIIEGDEQDYLMAKEVLDKLDEQQPQVAIEVLILGITVNDSRELGTQLRSKVSPGGTDGLLGNTVKFQTSGLYGTAGIQTVPNGTPGVQGANILLANLINLAVGAPTGNTLVSLGTDSAGVWGLLQALQTVANTQIIATPFLVATNNTPAVVSIGQTRRVVVANVVATTTQTSQDDKDANLVVRVTPQINSDGKITLVLDITVNQFADTTNYTSATVNVKHLVTNTVVSNGEVLALGGLIQNNIVSNMSQTPILGKIPILGWLFKNRQDQESKNNLLILICPRILPPDSSKEANKFTQERIIGYHTTLADMLTPNSGRDPVEKFFFNPKNDSVDKTMEDYLFKRHDQSVKMVNPEKKRLQKNQHARKRASRNWMTRDTNAPDKNHQPEQAHQTSADTTSVNPEMVAAQANENQNNDNAPIEMSAAKNRLKRSPQRTRRSLSTFMDDSEPEGVIS